MLVQDDVRPISCRGHDSQGGVAITLIDALDTLLVSSPDEPLAKNAAAKLAHSVLIRCKLWACLPRLLPDYRAKNVWPLWKSQGSAGPMGSSLTGHG